MVFSLYITWHFQLFGSGQNPAHFSSDGISMAEQPNQNMMGPEQRMRVLTCNLKMISQGFYKHKEFSGRFSKSSLLKRAMTVHSGSPSCLLVHLVFQPTWKLISRQTPAHQCSQQIPFSVGCIWWLQLVMHGEGNYNKKLTKRNLGIVILARRWGWTD